MFRFILVDEDGDVTGTNNEALARAAAESAYTVIDLENGEQRFLEVNRKGELLRHAFD